MQIIHVNFAGYSNTRDWSTVFNPIDDGWYVPQRDVPRDSETKTEHVPRRCKSKVKKKVAIEPIRPHKIFDFTFSKYTESPEGWPAGMALFTFPEGACFVVCHRCARNSGYIAGPTPDFSGHICKARAGQDDWLLNPAAKA